MYLDGIYGEPPEDMKDEFPMLMALGIAYPTIYDSVQLYKSGWAYFSDPWNYTDIVFSVGGIVNVIF